MENINEIIMQNKRLIYKLASYFSNYKDKEDLFQVGCIGLIEAYNKFKDDKNTKFTTYAYPFILGEMRKYVREDKGIKFNRNISSLSYKIEEASIALAQKMMREPTIAEISSFLEISEDLVIDSIKSKNIICSIDNLVNENLSLHEIIAAKDIDLNTLIALKSELESLSETDKQIINNRYINDMTQEETSKVLGMSQVEVSRKEKKLRYYLKNKLVS